MKRIAIATIAIQCALASAAMAESDLKELKGYKQFQFGMSLGEVKNFTDLREPAESPDDALEYEAKDYLFLIGHKYRYFFQFHDGKLRKITLKSEFEDKPDQCRSLAAPISAQLTKIYGPSDKPKDIGIGTLITIPMKNYAFIALSVTAKDSTCYIRVHYIDNAPDWTF